MPALDTVIGDNQNGFRAGRSVDANIEFYNSKFYSALHEGRHYDILFIDFAKAFDSCSHSAIFSLLSQIGLDPGSIQIIKALFLDAHCYTTIDPATSKRIDFHVGVKQGCPLSPVLFILLMDVLSDMLVETTGTDVKLYADDAALGDDKIAPKLATIKSCFDTFRNFTGLDVNISKTTCISTYNHHGIRRALDVIGWAKVIICGSVVYLGIPIGRLAGLAEVFEKPFLKLLNRLRSYSAVKRELSIPKRIMVWNTWLLPILSFTMKIFLLPGDYLKTLEVECAHFLNTSNFYAGLLFSRPPSLVGLATPLRDAQFSSLSSLISHANHAPRVAEENTSTMLIADHRQLAADYVSHTLGLQVGLGDAASATYSKLLNSRTNTDYHRDQLLHKLSKVHIIDGHAAHLMSNFTALPSWVPDYARFLNIAISHNALFTTSRQNIRDEMDLPYPCHLCRTGLDKGSHLFGDCQVASEAYSSCYNKLGLSTNYSFNFNFTTCSQENMAASNVALHFMLNSSIWRARVQAGRGDGRPTHSWPTWIIEDVLIRASKYCPDFFSPSNFPNNTIPLHYRIIYRPNFGSSHNTSPTAAAVARRIVQDVLDGLPPNATVIFTDGAACPNPGHTGAGAVIYATPQDHPVCLTAALGYGTNNIGDFFAIGMAVELCGLRPHPTDLHIFTDSKIALGCLQKNWRSNTTIVEPVRQAITKFKISTSCAITIHWVPGHSGIPQNEIADKLASAGAACSKNSSLNININEAVASNGFLSLTDSQAMPA